jgi:hypothetical protein
VGVVVSVATDVFGVIIDDGGKESPAEVGSGRAQRPLTHWVASGGQAVQAAPTASIGRPMKLPAGP